MCTLWRLGFNGEIVIAKEVWIYNKEWALPGSVKKVDHMVGSHRI